jgi:hypothetical protein
MTYTKTAARRQSASVREIVNLVAAIVFWLGVLSLLGIFMWGIWNTFTDVDGYLSTGQAHYMGAWFAGTLGAIGLGGGAFLLTEK